MVTRKDRKHYSREFKEEAVKRTFEAGKPVAEVARELNISVHLLYRWRDLYAREGAEKASPNDEQKAISDQNAEIKRLKKENARLLEEREILKKSLVFFAKEQEKGSDSSKNTEENSK